MNQPIEEKWKIAEDNIIDKVQDCVYGLNLNVGGKEYNEILRQIKGSIWLRGEIQRVFENLLEQERKKLVKQIDSFPLSDLMFFDENNWEAGYKALEEFKLSIINE